MARFVNDQAVLRRGDGPFRPFGGAPTLRGLLFPASEPGFTFEPWDITTLYQDRAGTTPVTAAGQSVGYRRDKSQQTSWIDVTGAVWTKTAGDGVVSVVGDQITITGATTATQVTRTAGSVPFAAGQVRATVRADYSAATGVIFWLRGLPAALSNGATTTLYGSLNNSGLERFDVSSGTATLTIVGFSFWKGNHEVAVSDAKRGVYGWMPKTGRRNLLTYTEDLTNAVWSKSEVTISANVTTDPLGAAADKVIPSITSSGKSWTHNLGFTSSGAWTFSRVVKNDGYNFYAIALQNSTLTAAFYNLTTGAITSVGANVTATSAVDLGGGWWRVSLTTAQAIGFVQEYVSATDGFSAMTGNGTSGVIIGGAQWEAGSTATAYQRVNSQYDITEAGVPTCYYVQADGVDDAYVTPTITPNTDKVQVFAGIRKLSDANRGLLAEFSATPSLNSFTLFAPNSSANEYAWTSRGTGVASVTSATTYPAPISNVITGLGDISGDTATLRVNGTQVAQSTADQGTGNYLAYPAYIYARGGTTLPFSGYDFGHAVRFGPNLDAATIARVEALIARNTPEVTL